MPNRRPKLELIAPSASPEEAAAVAAAIEQFLRDTVPPPAPVAERQNPWLRAALLEGAGYGDEPPSVWGDAHPWGA
jgi:hypothetical protein